VIKIRQIGPLRHKKPFIRAIKADDPEDEGPDEA